MIQQPHYYRDLLEGLLEQNNTHEQRLQVLRDKFKYSGRTAEFDKQDQLVVRGNFNCTYNQLTSLAGAPTTVGGGFDCSGNQLTSLAGAPRIVGGGFFCNYNQLTSLAGAPSKVGGGFYCRDNQLTSLAGAPTTVGGGFFCQNNKLTSLDGAPRTVGHFFNCSNNPLTSLNGIPQRIKGEFAITVNPGTPLLKILGVEGITEFYFVNTQRQQIPELQDLFKEFYGRGPRGQLLCGIEMIKMGYKSNAKR